MSILDSALFGTPPEHAVEKSKEENVAVKTPEFDITQYVKKLGVSVGILAAASATALKLFDGKTPTGIIAACLGVTAVGMLGVCLISAVDIAARAYVTRGLPPTGSDSPPAAADKADAGAASKADATPGNDTAGLPIGVPSGRALAWLEGEPQPRLVLAVAGDGEASRYLLSGSERGVRSEGDSTVTSLEEPPAWHDGKEVSAVRAANLADWPEAPQA